MRHPVEQALHGILAEYGQSVCDTPQSVETFLRRHAKAHPREVGALGAALRCGVVKYLRTQPATDPASLSRMLVRQAHLHPPLAEWAVSAWTAALAAAPSPVPSARHGLPAARVAIALALAAATGVAAYFALAP